MAAMAASANAVPNSAMKKKRKRKPLYSVMYPATSSDSATGMSNGVWVSSACAATRKMKKPRNWVRMNGLPTAPNPKISPSACAATMPCMLMVPACMTTPITASTSGSS